jgi:precorrin-3B C17-methyltransferase
VSGSLRVIGLGPGPAAWLTPEASAALACASDVVGYRAYLARLAEDLATSTAPGQTLHGSDNGDELARARLALALAERGAAVALVSGGDPGVFAMAAAVFEAIEAGPASFRALDVAVLPGVTAMLAAAARLGAPLGNDFCAINLSDNLKPWRVIETRLRLAAQADFAIALYNPASRARPEQVRRAFELLRDERPAHNVVAFARAVGRPGEALRVTTLAEADPAWADMQTLVLIGATSTRCLERPDGTRWVYTPRRVERGP